MADKLDIQAIKDRVAKGRLQGGNPTGGDEGPFHLYHLALDDLDALVGFVERNPPGSTNRGDIDAILSRSAVTADPHLTPPRVADITDEEREKLLKVAAEHEG